MTEGSVFMKRMRMNIENDLTFGEGCNEYLRNCETRNLREGTIKLYKHSKCKMVNRKFFYWPFFCDTNSMQKCTQKYNLKCIFLNAHEMKKIMLTIKSLYDTILI